MNRILIVDDNLAIHSDFRKILSPEKPDNAAYDAAAALIMGTVHDPAGTEPTLSFSVDCASQGQEALIMLQQALTEGNPYCMAFVDIRMPPGWDGVETLTRLWEADPELQAVLCSAYSDYTWTDITRRLARPDRVLMLKKPFDAIEALQMATLLTEKWHAHQRETAQRARLDRLLAERTAEATRAAADSAESEERFALAFASSPTALAILDATTLAWTTVNHAFRALTSGPEADLLPACTLFAHQPELCTQLKDPDQPIHQKQIRIPSATGHREVLVSRAVFTLHSQPHLMLTIEDITTQVEAQNQLRQGQKMEAVGQLAAGLAHDFNNIMTVILGHVTTCLTNTDLDINMEAALQETRSAGMRAAALTKQLLAFGRKQVMQIVPSSVKDLLEQNRSMLTRLTGSHVTFDLSYPPDLPDFMADHNSFNQVLLNLTINARDALQGGGHIFITASIASSPSESKQAPTQSSNDHFIRITFRDTGVGMDELTRTHIFEPFFTTKAVGDGSGLGLSSIHGIMAQHGGWIECESSPGTGAAFHLYFPRAEQPATPVNSASQPFSQPAGKGWLVLVVEDELAIRRMLCAILQRFGFRTLDAPDAASALTIWEDPVRPPIDALFTDIVMPGGMSGLQLARLLLESQPSLRVVFSSGYSTDLLHSSHSMSDCGHFLPKPYDLEGVSRILQALFPTPQSAA